VSKVMRAECGHAGITAGASDGHSEVVGAPNREQGRCRIAIFPCREAIHHDAEEIVGELDPARLPRLGDLRPNEPRLAAFV
jgi:hypothetical protein